MSAEREDVGQIVECVPGPVGRRMARRSRGQSIAELALTLPLLLLLLFGTVDFGRAFFSYIQLRNAAFEGARYGSKFPSDTAGITSKVTQHGVPANTSVAVTLSGSWNQIDGNGTVTVAARSTFTPITTSFLQTYFGLRPFTVGASATMKVMT